MKRFCKNCGKELADTAKFCPGCGKKIQYKISETKHTDAIENNASRNYSEIDEKIVNDNIEKMPVKAESKHIIKKIIMGIAAMGVIGTGAYIGVSKIYTKPVETVKDNNGKNSIKKNGNNDKSEEMNTEFVLTQEQKEQILLAATLFDNGKRREDLSYTQGDYTIDIKKGSISTDILRYVVGGMLCSDNSVGEKEDSTDSVERKYMTADECKQFMQETFEYKLKDQDEIAEIFTTSEGANADSFEAKFEGAENYSTNCNVRRFEQTGKDKYHFEVEVTSKQDTENPIGIMDITAHKNNDSKIGGFVFEKIEFSTDSNKEKLSKDIDLIISNVVRVKAESSNQNYDFNPVGEYSINQLSNNEFINMANAVFTKAEYIAQDREDKMNDYGGYEGEILSEKRYKSLCKDTLGRTEPYDYQSSNVIENGKVTFEGMMFDVDSMWFGVQEEYVIRSMDGTLKIEGVLRDYKSYALEKYYSFEADAHEDSKSDLGMIIDKLEVLKEVKATN